MAGFHPPKHNNIVFRYNAFLCAKDWHYRLLNLATGKKKGQICSILMTWLSLREKLMIQFMDNICCKVS